MIEGELLYFTPAEFIVMMELAGDGNYSMIRSSAPEPDDAALARAFLTLFNRGLIKRRGNGFAPDGAGSVFADMRIAAGSILIYATHRREFAAMCYVGGETAWLVEIVDDALTQRYRLQKLDIRTINDWLFDAELLERPTLKKEDAVELETLLKDVLNEPYGRMLLKLERHVNGGARLYTYELLGSKLGNILIRSDAEGRTAEIYTQEALSAMLAECFGKESHDYSEC